MTSKSYFIEVVTGLESSNSIKIYLIDDLDLKSIIANQSDPKDSRNFLIYEGKIQTAKVKDIKKKVVQVLLEKKQAGSLHLKKVYLIKNYVNITNYE